MNKVFKIISILLILLFMITILPLSKTMALVDSGGSGDSGSISTDIIGDARRWFEEARTGGSSLINPGNVATSLKPIGQILFWAGVIVLVVAYPVMGIKYMISEPDKKADLKTKLIGLVIASVVILGAYGIWKVTYIFMSELIH